MNTQGLVDLIIRISDTSNALNTFSVSTLLEVIKEIDDHQKILDDAGFQEALSDARAFKTMSDYRWGLERMLLTTVRHVVEVLGIKLRWQAPSGQNILLVDTVDVVTHTGPAEVWCIWNIHRDSHNLLKEEEHEYHEDITNNLFHAIYWRSRMPRNTSRYGWSDPAYINRPDIIREYDNQWDIN